MISSHKLNIWQELYRSAREHAPSVITTTLLGPVSYSTGAFGITAHIPWVLKDEANKHGLEIIAANWKEGTYTLQLLPAAPPTLNLPVTDAELKTLINVLSANLNKQQQKPYLNPGEVYAGELLDIKGNPAYRVILLPEVSPLLTWMEAVTWASKLGGRLPTIRECLLLQVNCATHLHSGQLHWTCDSPPHYSFDKIATRFGTPLLQDEFHMDRQFIARAVRYTPPF